MSASNVLLVGGNGFLGWHAASAFADRGDVVYVLDQPGSSATASAEWGETTSSVVQFEGSVTDQRMVIDAVAAASADVIVLLASFGSGTMGLVRAAESDPAAAVDVNVGGLLNVLEAAQHSRARRVLWLSSTTVYGRAETYAGPTVDEDDHVAPASVYAATKVLGEQLIRSYRSAHGILASAIRPTLVWGPGIRYRGVQSALNDIVEGATEGVLTTVADSDEVLDLLYVRDAGRAIAWLADVDLGPTILVNGYRAGIRDVRDAAVAQMPHARLELSGMAPRLGFPYVDDRRIRNAGFKVQFTLEESIADYRRTLSRTAIGGGSA